MHVEEILSQKSTDLITIGPESPVSEAVALLAKHNIGTVLVIGTAGELVGILSERDVVRALSKSSLGLEKLLVHDLMTASVVTCAPNDIVDDALFLMGIHHIRHLPVVQDDEIIGVLSVRDVLEFRLQMMREHLQAVAQAQVEAELSNRAKTEFLSNVSHELKTPLNAIIGFADFLAGQPLAGAQENFLDDIARSGRHLLEIIENILDLSRLDLKELNPREEVLSIPKIITTCIQVIAERAERSDLKLRVNADNDIPMLAADRRMTKQMLTNLLSNAVKFTPKGGEISVDATILENGLCIRVSDTGIGIAQEHLAKVVEPFQQADPSLARPYDGLGLGLTLVNLMIRAHGGTLSLESEVGAGTVAMLTFPRERVVDQARYAA